ncbi:MAG: hypothetical protein R6V75_09730 [Bacteroidales bacterium]
MNWLEEIIKENKEMFAQEEPPAGHFERFEARLRQEVRRRRLKLVYRISSIAAIGLIALASAIFVYDRLIDQDTMLFTLGDVSPELGKVEFYYTSQIGQNVLVIDTLTAALTGEDYRRMVQGELASMDSVYLSLQQKLGAHPGDERIVNAMIRFYQTKLAIMNELIAYLNQINQTNNPKIEDNEFTLF